MTLFKARPAQKEILKYTGGLMGINAVPGSGKTHTLSFLAANLIKNSTFQDDQEILVVTLVNSAVENFSKRIATFIKGFGLLPNTGYRIRTLHGLSHDIVRERPDLAGLSDRFQIIDERETGTILNNIVANWLHVHPQFIEMYASADAEGSNAGMMKNWELLLIDTAASFIRLSKDYQYSSSAIQAKLHELDVENDLLQFGLDIYQEYQRALHYRSAVDFDDLIWLALRALESDPEFLERLQLRWPYILEDEAQDSSRLQEKILRLLAGEGGNWVRVGDPNQAIFETFTTAHPRHLIDFIERRDVKKEKLPDSGRSTASIIALANHLILWSRSPENPNPDMQGALVLPLINPTPPKDPQPNPPDRPDAIVLHAAQLTPERELRLVAQSIARWLPENADKTVAVLVPRNERGAKMVDELHDLNIQTVELLRSSASTRQTADILASILDHLSNPTAVRRLAELYRKIRSLEENHRADHERIEQVYRILSSLSHPERLLWPTAESDWVSDLSLEDLEGAALSELEWFSRLIKKWHRAAILSIDQLILTISRDIFSHPMELALAHKLALSMETAAENHPEWLLPNFADELLQIAENRRKFYGFSSEDTGFDPDEHKGKVVIATIHKAKGLEWDRVYLLSVNTYDFPYGSPQDSYIGEKWFVRGNINIAEETLARLKALLEDDRIGLYLEEGEATRNARIEYARERLRLFYVGVTRAKSELIITWNTGKNGKIQPSVPLRELIRFWSNKNVTSE